MFSFRRRTAHFAGATALAVLAAFTLAGPLGSQTHPAAEKLQPEVSDAAREFLGTMNSAQEKVLQSNPGLSAEVVAKIMAHRAAGKQFSNLLEFKRTTGISLSDLELAMKPLVAKEQEREIETSRKPVPEPSRAGGREGTDEPAEDAPQGAADGPIGSIRPGYYGRLPGYDDLDKLEPTAKKAFLEAVNREMCSCGCVSETLAFCLVNDPGCPVVKARVKKMYDDTVSKPPR